MKKIVITIIAAVMVLLLPAGVFAAAPTEAVDVSEDILTVSASGMPR